MCIRDSSGKEQDRSLSPSSRRRVVLATNLAESSVTVPGVRVVVDSGLVRRPRLDHATGLDALVTERVSVASADQRAGRAGRTEPGVCRRLWTPRMHRSLDDFDPPEIERVSLASAVLSLIESGVEPTQFRWMDAPSALALDAAQTLLEQLGATHEGLSLIHI